MEVEAFVIVIVIVHNYNTPEPGSLVLHTPGVVTKQIHRNLIQVRVLNFSSD
jgi:hypothetical protein